MPLMNTIDTDNLLGGIATRQTLNIAHVASISVDPVTATDDTEGDLAGPHSLFAEMTTGEYRVIAQCDTPEQAQCVYEALVARLALSVTARIKMSDVEADAKQVLARRAEKGESATP